MKYSRITDAQIESATKLMHDGHSWRVIAKAVGASHDGIRRRVDPKFRMMKNESASRSHYGRGNERYASTGVSANVHHKHAPDSVIAECVTAHGRTRSLTAEILGDPLPGRSALDKIRRGETP